MGQKTSPTAFRVGITKDWYSRWFSAKKYIPFLKDDVSVRSFLVRKLKGMSVDRIEIERGTDMLNIIVYTSRPGLIIGRGGDGASKLKADLVSTMKKRGVIIPEDFKFDIVEVANPDADAAIVACMIAEGLEKRLPFRRVMKQTIEKVMTARGVKGARIYLGGRLGGAEIARSEQIKRGSIPLQTFRADVDFAREKAHMSYGDIGIKVWIYRGEVFSAEGGATGSKNNKQ